MLRNQLLRLILHPLLRASQPKASHGRAGDLFNGADASRRTIALAADPQRVSFQHSLKMDLLFGKARLNDVFQSTRQNLLKEINEFQADYLLNVSTEDLIGHLVEKYIGEPPILHEDKIEICDQGELKEKGYDNVPRRIGFYFVFAIPFSGEIELFYYRPTS